MASLEPSLVSAPHKPLSDDLENILADCDPVRGLSLNELMVRTEGRGFYFILIVLSLPFIVPLPLPGLSNILGVVIIILAVRLGFGLPARLPRFIGKRMLEPAKLQTIIRNGLKFVRWLEKWIRPRKGSWLAWPAARCANAAVIGVMGLLLALPFPPIIPLSNSLPSYGIILLALSMMEEDSTLIWFGYAMAAFAFVYLFGVLAVAGDLVLELLVKRFDHIVEFFRGLL